MVPSIKDPGESVVFLFPMPYNAKEIESEVLTHWDKEDCFNRSVQERPAKQPYVFYDGPPFATGLPHYGHIVASLMKDIVPRYFTMKGFRVERVWGWDCHGLPIENIIEQDNKLRNKQDIEAMGIAKFNEACRSTVLRYAEEWKKTIRRMGRWVDMENAYHTMDTTYMESVWWVFKQLWDTGLIYEGRKSMHICPRCATPLSNFEVTQGYKEVKDVSCTSKFLLTNAEKILGVKEKVFALAWTTTPWTLPGNVLLAVGPRIDYVRVKVGDEQYLLAKNRLEAVMKDRAYEIEEEYKGKKLVGLTYEPLFPYFSSTANGFRIVVADFVSTEEGTGIVHIAPAFGEDDYELGQRENTGWVQHVDMTGRFIDLVSDFVGQEVKPKDSPSQADIEMIKYLQAKERLFSKESYVHSYPHCWRCDSPLLNYSTSSWFVKVADLKEDLLKTNEQTNWVPGHMKEGRFGKWLEGARDWAISRDRYWGTPLPIWKNAAGDTICVGSVADLESLTGKKVTDLHKHIVDDLVITRNGEEYRRIPQVLDCWFESGSMPYGQSHYPFENKEKFESSFPAEFIAEGQDQTRGWFYTLHVLATALTRGRQPIIPVKKTSPAFKNVVVNGIVLAEDGKKMSKRLKNYPDPNTILEKYGADAMRYYLAVSPVMHAESLNFSEAGVREVYNKLMNTLWNVVVFYQLFSGEKENQVSPSTAVLDKWILSRLQQLVKDTGDNLEKYQLAEASRPILDFVTDLSQWYVRRSRERFKGNDEQDKQWALATLEQVLLTLAKVLAPFTPFLAEKMYQILNGPLDSVHLESWPIAGKLDTGILADMEKAKKIVELGLSLRVEKGMKVRQVLRALSVSGEKITPALAEVIAEELNVKEVKTEIDSQGEWVTRTEGDWKISLDVALTPELKREGVARELIRTINQMRKEQGLTVQMPITVYYHTSDPELLAVLEEYVEDIKSSVLASTLVSGDGEEITVAERKIKLSISK